MTPPRPSVRAAQPPAEIVELIERGELEAIEEQWLSRLEDGATENADDDFDYFAAVAGALARAGEAEHARFLLQLLDEQLVSDGRWDDRLELLRRAGRLLHDDGELHPAILENLDKLRGARPSFAQMVEQVGLHRAVDDLPKTWKKVGRLLTLLDFDVGSIVRMEGKGAGRVVEVNMALESFKVEFENGLQLLVGFGGAAKLLEPLPENHLLRRKIEDPESLERLRDKAPGELLRVVLESYGEPRTGAEIKRSLQGLVPDKRWSSWWAAARKHPQVLAAPGGRRAYTWAASSGDALDAVWQSFEKADARTRLELLRRDGVRDDALLERMVDKLSAMAQKAQVSDPGLACEIYFHLEKAGRPAGASATELIADSRDPRPLFAGIRDRALRERAYDAARETRDDWPQLYVQLLWQEHDPRSLDLLSDALIEHSPQLFESFFDQLMSQPRKNPPAFVWLAERAAERQEWLERNPSRLLKQILSALHGDDFATLRTARLVPLADSGGTVPRLLSHLSEDQARGALELIERAPGLEGYQRKPLANAIQLRFPALQSDQDAPLYALPESITARRAELKELVESEIPANRRAIEEARELGDLRENFEYKSARQRHEYLTARAEALRRDLERARPIDPEQVQGDEVVIGSRVSLVTSGGARTLTLLGPWESAPENDVLSNESDMAKALIGLKLGDTVELGGEEHRVEAIEPFDPAGGASP